MIRRVFPSALIPRILRRTAPLLVLGGAAAIPASAAPPLDARQYTMADGLPVDGVTDLLFDRDGYLWIATFNGLACFDGVEFRLFHPANTPGMESARLLRLAPDANGGIWAMAQLGPPLRVHGGRVTTYGVEQGLGAEYVLRLLCTDAGDVLVATWNGVRRLEGDRFVPFPADSVGLAGRVLHRDDSGAYWVGLAGEGFARIRDGVVTRFEAADGAPPGRVRAFCDLGDGSVLVAAAGGLVVVAQDRVRPVPFAATDPHALLASPGRDTTWVAAEEGVLRFTEGHATRIAPRLARESHWVMTRDHAGRLWSASGDTLYREGVPVFVPPSIVRAVAFDPEGGVWVATDRNGMFHLTEPRVSMALEGLSCYPVLEDRNGDLWVGTIRDGLHRIRLGRAEAVPSPGAFIAALHQDSDGTLWAGTDGGLFRRDGEEWREVPWTGQLGRVPVFGIHRDRTGVLWVGTSSGLHRLVNGSWEVLYPQHGEVSEYVRAFLEAPNGDLWMAFRGGGLLRHRQGTFRRWTVDDGLSGNDVRSLHLDADGVLWIGTEDRGLNRLDTAGEGPIVRVSTGEGLANSTVNGIFEDDAGRLWFSGNRGVHWVARSELNALARGEVASVRSVLQSGLIETNGGVHSAGIRARDGRFWIPTVRGVLVMDPGRSAGLTMEAVARIDRVTFRGNVVDHHAGAVRLPLGQREFDVAFTAPAYRAPENLRFRYRLAGLDDTWVDAGARRVAYFTHVPPGAYRFEVAASSVGSASAGVPTVLQVTVPARYHETAWFRGGAGLAAAALIFAAYRRRVGNIEKRGRELARIVEERTRDLRREKENSEGARRDAETALAMVERQARELAELDRAKSHFYANVSHEFRTPLTLTLGPLEDVLAGLRGAISDEAREDIETASRSSRRLLRLVNQILDLAKLESGHLRAHRHTADVVGLLRDVAHDFVPLAERRRLWFELDVPARPVWVNFDPELLSQVFLNLLGNAFKFTPEEGRVRVDVVADEEAGRVRIAVRDTGPGIPEEEIPFVFERFHQVDEAGVRLRPGTGIGLALTRELVALHEGMISVDSRPGEGSSFVVDLPVASAPKRVDREVSRAFGASARAVLDVSAPAPASPADGSSEREGDDACTVLLIEDNAELRAYLGRHLSNRYRVLEASDGDAGLECIRRELPDLVVSDVLMPGLSGYDLVREVRRDPDICFVPIVLLTARAALDDTVEGLDAGAEDYVLKPFRVEELRARIRSVLASRRRLREAVLRDGAPSGNGATAADGAPGGADAPLEVATPGSTGASPGIPSADDRFLDRVRAAVHAGYPDEDFSVELLAERVGLNRSHLSRRLKELGAPSPSDMIREARLTRAAELLRSRAGNVGEIAYAVGFRSLAHFSRAFRDRFGVPPSRIADPPA